MNVKHIVAITLTATTALCALHAQTPPPDQSNNQQGQGGNTNTQLPGHKHLPPPAILVALDINHDGQLSADEIANASASLLTLDKNGDGILTHDELCPHEQLNAARANRHNQNSGN
ncbi:MAG TPA: hypothetical protein VIM48_06915 [Chthoniobacterales bacterium]